MCLIPGNEPLQCPQPTEDPSTSAAAGGDSAEGEAADAASNMSEDTVSLRENKAVCHHPNEKKPLSKPVQMKRRQKCFAI